MSSCITFARSSDRKSCEKNPHIDAELAFNLAQPIDVGDLLDLPPVGPDQTDWIRSLAPAA